MSPTVPSPPSAPPLSSRHKAACTATRITASEAGFKRVFTEPLDVDSNGWVITVLRTDDPAGQPLRIEVATHPDFGGMMRFMPGDARSHVLASIRWQPDGQLSVTIGADEPLPTAYLTMAELAVRVVRSLATILSQPDR